MEPARPDKPRNPYSPPGAAVDDAAAASRPMPGAVRRALILYVISFVWGLVLMFVARAAGDARYAELSAVANAVSVAIIFVIGAWLFWKISAGRNWARIVLLVLTVLSVPSAILDILPIVRTWPLGTVLKIIEQCMDIAVVYLLFIPGRAYFRR